MSPENEAEIVEAEINRLFADRDADYRRRVLVGVLCDASCRASLLKTFELRQRKVAWGPVESSGLASFW